MERETETERESKKQRTKTLNEIYEIRFFIAHNITYQKKKKT